MQQRYVIIVKMQGRVLMLGLMLVRGRQTKAPATDDAELLMYATRKEGLSFKPARANIITLMPPLRISQTELDDAFDIFKDCLAHRQAYHRYVNKVL